MSRIPDKLAIQLPDRPIMLTKYSADLTLMYVAGQGCYSAMIDIAEIMSVNHTLMNDYMHDVLVPGLDDDEAHAFLTGARVAYFALYMCVEVGLPPVNPEIPATSFGSNKSEIGEWADGRWLNDNMHALLDQVIELDDQLTTEDYLMRGASYVSHMVNDAAARNS